MKTPKRIKFDLFNKKSTFNPDKLIKSKIQQAFLFKNVYKTQYVYVVLIVVHD